MFRGKISESEQTQITSGLDLNGMILIGTIRFKHGSTVFGVPLLAVRITAQGSALQV